MNASDTFVLELTSDELRLVTNALESFMSDFGHDEADIHRTIRQILAKVNSVTAGAGSATAVTQS